VGPCLTGGPGCCPLGSHVLQLMSESSIHVGPPLSTHTPRPRHSSTCRTVALPQPIITPLPRVARGAVEAQGVAALSCIPSLIKSSPAAWLPAPHVPRGFTVWRPAAAGGPVHLNASPRNVDRKRRRTTA
jgi:hypothetical protein